jgi:hypothetical protein
MEIRKTSDFYKHSNKIRKQIEIFDKFSLNSNKLFNNLKEKFKKHPKWNDKGISYELCVLPRSEIINSEIIRIIEVFFGHTYINSMCHPDENQVIVPLFYVLQYSQNDLGYSDVCLYFIPKLQNSYKRKFIIIDQTYKMENLVNKIERHYYYLINFISMEKEPTLRNKFVFKRFMYTKKYNYKDKIYPPIIKRFLKKKIMSIIISVIGGVIVGIILFYILNDKKNSVKQDKPPSIIPEKSEIEIINGFCTIIIEAIDETDELPNIIDE